MPPTPLSPRAGRGPLYWGHFHKSGPILYSISSNLQRQGSISLSFALSPFNPHRKHSVHRLELRINIVIVYIRLVYSVIQICDWECQFQLELLVSRWNNLVLAFRFFVYTLHKSFKVYSNLCRIFFELVKLKYF